LWQVTKIAVLIPCYNEAATIAKVVTDFKAVLPAADIYVYDNNSTDATADLARAAGAIVRHEYRQGKGNVLRQMFRDIEADCYLCVDGDDTYPAPYAREMIDFVLDKQFDMATGDRLSSTYFKENKRRFHNAGNRTVRWLINFLFKSQIQDIMTGYRAFSRRFVKSFPILSTGFEIETEMTIHALDKNLLVYELPISYRNRPENSFSKLHTVRDGTKVMKTIFTLYKDYKPLSFFSVASIFIFTISLFFGVPVVWEYLETGFVDRFPTLFTCGFGVIASLLLFCCGLILDVIVKKDRRQFEILLNTLSTQN